MTGSLELVCVKIPSRDMVWLPYTEELSAYVNSLHNHPGLDKRMRMAGKTLEVQAPAKENVAA